MRIIIIGGHLSPAFSVIQEFKEEEILLVGRKYAMEGDSALSLEYQFAKEHDVSFEEITTGRLQRKFTIHTVSSLFKFPLGFIQAISILRSFKPNIVVGFGGYVQLPIIFAAKILGIPVIIHEQTFEAGFANEIASFFADKVLISWESSRKYFSKNKTIITGNPVRKEILSAKVLSHVKKSKPLIYITGGSLGSHKINTLVQGCLEELLKTAEVIHQTGDSKAFSDFDKLCSIREKLPKTLKENYKLNKFFSADKVASIYNKADLVISRSGVNTVTELFYLKKPALLIPLSFAQKNEQFKNAEFLKEMGLAEIGDDNMNSQEFLSIISSMIKNLKNYQVKNLDFERKTIQEAAGKIAKIIWENAKV
ncbi:UDP-N-acetylglucosamine--N-acetylmuramyl-(pentapeptide) pyrophosphoryl-undecaprenol N-acetylglucosamine transferase [Patescibacteria group bacterium]|nr:UDP-N-acetylglucosamine--N-acetylmuramyl-(pentapeptide) pyrophosphoryl-undecaprenol N-acetylglucosamine transferase [Patescibacteria group bacterium]